ncbi:MFS transporter [Paenibacillus apiarius]|uniref:MFS transporter n=1 Tax=Paenibacillus apiarius TaxID=46240 RepID=A0ABT4DZY1_9BACL|nr:MFS transporter [Paenibacillus apiarius]MBN3522793.1 MFS transporter [Paenibacillus apiarius]MCY9515089.1 MFS transporter [Paenibacillus apiarius]MCY9522925.1 MFS transporter [Paenibacillus apiarius]MCY9553728.1 MFS transporter [Paenibacillus apiarius]MCY9556439.1 MFS transporter [Paenibacillus apiarius]
MAKQQARSMWLEYAALATVPLVLVLGNSMLVPILPEVKRHLHLTQLQTSLIITLFSVTAGIVIPFSGYLSDRFGRKKVMIPSLIIYGIAGILTGLGAMWGSYGMLIGSRALQGLGAAGTASIAMALVGDLYKDAQESQALGLIEASNGAGKVISPILGSALALWTWTAPFFAFPVFCALSLAAVTWLIHEPDQRPEAVPIKKYLHNIKDIFKQKGRWLIPAFFAGSLALFILFGILFYLSDILEEKPYSIKGIMKGLVLAIPLLGMVTTAYITGNLIKKNGVLIRWLINIGLLMMAVSLGFTIFFNKNVYGFISLITVSSIGTGLLLPCLNTMITGSVDKAERGMILSLYNSLRFLGVAFGPPLFSWLMDISHRVIFITVTVLSAIAFVLVFLFIKPDKEVR